MIKRVRQGSEAYMVAVRGFIGCHATGLWLRQKTAKVGCVAKILSKHYSIGSLYNLNQLYSTPSM